MDLHDAIMLYLRSVNLKLSPGVQRLANFKQPSYLRRLAAPANFNHHLEVGAVLHGFNLQRIKNVPELQLTAFHLRHEKTGAEYLHVARDDKNNVFSIGFKTNPPDATGVPHILEHTTLCGSKRYLVTFMIKKIQEAKNQLDTQFGTHSSKCFLVPYQTL